MKPVFPYPTLFGDVDFEVERVTVDGIALPYAHVSREERVVALHRAGRDRWETAGLTLRARLPDGEIADGPWSEPVCLAVLSDRATNVRTTARLARAADGFWRGRIDLDRDSHPARATLDLTVAATVHGVAGRLVGSTEQPWYVDLRASEPVRRREITIVEEDFRESRHTWLHQFKDSPWIVETAGDEPVVYLNSAAVEGLMELLNGSGGSPTERLLRELTAGKIAQDAWSAMLHTSVADLDMDEDGTPRMPGGWREQVLRMMLPDVLPGRQPTDALHEIHRRRTEGSGWSELQTGIQYAVGRRSRIAKHLTSAVRSVDRAEKDDD